ncbi:hypothetical protein GCM10020258_19890 [Sphingomonas yabuuchiae]
MAAAVDHAADTDQIADLVPGHVAADGGHAADDLMSRHARILGARPFAARGVQVGMADAAIKDVDRDIVALRVATLEGKGASGVSADWAA